MTRLGRHTSIALVVVALLATACSSARRALRQGDEWMEQDRHRAAARAYERGLDAKPDHLALQIAAAEAWLEAGEPQKSLLHARTAAESGDPEATGVFARALIATFQHDEALQVLQAELEADPSAARYGLMAEAHLGRGDLDAALNFAARASARGEPRELVFHAWLLARTGAGPKAIEEANRARKAALDDALVQAEAAAVLLLSGDAGAAEEAAGRAVMRHPSIADGWKAQAAARQDAGDQEGALRLSMRVFALQPADAATAWRAGVLWLQLGVYERAADLLSQALDLPPYAISEVGSAVYVADYEDLAPEERDAARRAIGVALADAYRGLGDREHEAEALQAAVEAGAGAEEMFRLSQIWKSLGHVLDAQSMALRALRADPSHAEATLEVSRWYAENGKVDDAIRYALTGWQQRRGHVELASFLAQLYEQRGEIDLAIEVLTITVRQVGSSPTLQAHLDRLLTVKRRSVGAY